MDRTSLIVLFLFSLSFLNNKSFATTEAVAAGRHHVLVVSLRPATTCTFSPSKVSGGRQSTLQVVHRHGPCANLTTNGKRVTASELLTQDEFRVKSIQSRAALNSGDSVSVPAKSGVILGTGNYIVTVGLGTPRTDLSLAIDTGSDLTWTQCEPCATYCYPQKEKIFDPSLSKSYANVSCKSSECAALKSATGFKPGCEASTNTCIYLTKYGDKSFTSGYFATETLDLSSDDVIPNILFGCGQNNKGTFYGAAGILGLGRDSLSFGNRTAGKYGNYFSYCLPSPSATGHLTFGRGKTANIDRAKFTPLKFNSRDPTLYFVDIVGIKVDEKFFRIDGGCCLFNNPGRTLIDSGTVITRLPPKLYSAVKTEFRKQMRKYSLTNPIGVFDTCYDFSAYKSVEVLIPKMSIYFRGNVEVELPGNGILYTSSWPEQVCFAFVGNKKEKDVTILGNAQQQSLEVIYDVAGGKLGFVPGACS